MTTTVTLMTTDAFAFEIWRQKNCDRLEELWGKILGRFEKGQPPEVLTLIEAMRYSLLGGGKRLRPLLALAAAEAVGGQAKEALPAALAVEMVHCYSLIHDDLPAMDNDDLRRGKPTCHKAFGEDVAILAGDAMLTAAFEVLAECGVKKPETAPLITRAIVCLAKAAGASGMVGGQSLDLAFEKHDGRINGDMVRGMEWRKTGELISAALVCGATLAGGSASQLKLLRKIGLASGMAFQIRDDLLNISGDPQVLGKAVGSDAARGKASFPAVFGQIDAERELKALAEKALAGTVAFGSSGGNMASLIEQMVNRRM